MCIQYNHSTFNVLSDQHNQTMGVCTNESNKNNNVFTIE